MVNQTNKDDGPSDHTLIVLNWLKQNNKTATFFVVGGQAAKFPDIIKQIVEDKHEIGIHTWSHHALTSLTNEQIISEIDWTRKLIKDTTGYGICV
jgi:peptidoglycan/xylan/chitin deacetylase (PgdA/CDA1 family)